MEHNTVSALEQQLGALATPVGFAFGGRAVSIDETPPPAGTLLWESSYALLALVPLSQDAKGLNATQEAAQDWIWRRLTQSERLGKFLDGYLVFALKSKPDDASVVQRPRFHVRGLAVSCQDCLTRPEPSRCRIRWLCAVPTGRRNRGHTTDTDVLLLHLPRIDDLQS